MGLFTYAAAADTIAVAKASKNAIQTLRERVIANLAPELNQVEAALDGVHDGTVSHETKLNALIDAAKIMIQHREVNAAFVTYLRKQRILPVWPGDLVSPRKRFI